MLIGTENKPLISVGSRYIPSVNESCVRTFSILNLPFGENISDSEFFAFSVGTQIPNSKYKLQQYIPAKVEKTADGFVIRCYSIDEEAYGETRSEAYFDFLTSIRDHYESLVKRVERLSIRDKAVLERLRSLLQSN
jgi:hypothetical protein